MRVLLLGPERPDLSAFLESGGDQVTRVEEPIDATSDCLEGVDWIVSYGYRHIIRGNVLERFPNRAVNLHISYLPWNRGADPNLWSFLEDTPKGVTVHYIDEGIDTGDIIAQREVLMAPDDTLRSSYAKLTRAGDELFRAIWPALRRDELTGRRQPSGGSVHRMKDKLQVTSLLEQGWDTPVSNLIGKGIGIKSTGDRGR